MNRLIVAILSFLVSIHICVALEKRSSDDTFIVCSQEPIDFGIVLDSSSSINDEDFVKARSFLISFLDQYEIGDQRNDVRVSIITFGLGIYPQDSFNLDSYHTKAGVLGAIAKIPHRFGPYTDTGLAIEYMRTHQLSFDRVRPYAEKISLVITDGNSQNWPETRDQAKLARKDNITMFALGVGSEKQVQEEELLRIAGDKDRTTRVDNFDSLEGVTQLLAKKTCIAKKRATTPVPKEQTCGEQNPADIEFIFSPADMGLDATAWTTSFITNTIESQSLDTNFRYGVRTGSCPIDRGFNLDQYNNEDDIDHHLSYYDSVKLPSLISNDLFSKERGGRDKARDVAVLVVSGNKAVKGGELEAKIQELLDNNVQVYVANPAGYPVNIAGTTALSGRSSRSQAADLVQSLCPELSGTRS